MIPFSGYFFSCEPTEEVTIKIFERFDNEDFGLESIDILVPNEALQFKTARMRVKTELDGVRYLMQTWFFTFALACIMSSTVGISVFLCIAILILKRLYLPVSWARRCV